MSKIPKTAIGKIDEGAARANPATRGAILDRLKREGEASAGALGEALGVTPMAARLHLYELEKEGLVAARSEPQGRGRPVKLWSLTEEASRIFPDAHQGLAVELIRSVEGLFGEAGLAKVIERHGAQQRESYRARLAGAKSLGERVKRLAKARADEGYMAEARRDGKDWLLVENHCPICSAARVCTRLCANELSVFRDVLGKDVSVAREEHILAGARRCAYRVRAREETGA
jgi:predicted ArsR family transcriptional regulator